MNAVILEGKNEGLIPLTLNCPKLMLNIMDKPLISHIRDYLINYGIDKYTLLENGWGNSFPEDIEKRIFSFTDKDSIIDIIKKEKEDVVLISRPMITDISLSKVIAYHKKYGGGITAVYNKGRETGIYIISKDALNNQEISYKKYNLNGYFSFVDTCEEYISLHKDILKGRLLLKTESSIINKGVMMGENTLLKIGALIKPPVFIGKGTVIESGARIDAYSVIGSDCVVSQGAHIAGAVINKGCFIGKYASLKKTLLAPSAKIKSKAVLMDMTAVGEASVIGEAATLSKGVRVWNERYIPDGEEITKNVVNGGKIPSFRFSQNKVTGKSGADFIPEDAALLGVLFSRLHPALKIAVGSSSASAAVMIKYAFISGAMSAGGQVSDLDVLTRAAFRFSVKQLNCAGGVYISEDNEEISVSFYAADSFDIRKKDFKRLKEMYPEGKFVRAEREAILPIENKRNAGKAYYNKICSETSGAKKEKYAFFSYDETYEEYVKMLSQASGIKLVKSRKHGCVSGELTNGKLKIYDENGKQLSEEEITKLFMIIIKKADGKFVLKDNQPPEINEFARKHNIKIINSYGEDYLKEIKEAGAEKQYLLYSDNVYAFFAIAEKLLCFNDEYDIIN